MYDERLTKTGTAPAEITELAGKGPVKGAIPGFVRAPRDSKMLFLKQVIPLHSLINFDFLRRSVFQVIKIGLKTS